jgi:hypothetical protein
MATLYAAVSGGTKDVYYFYHSQLRIRIEFTFGMLTHRWSILRSAIPMNVSIRKTVALVLALSKLHIYCIDQNDSSDLMYNNGAFPVVTVRDSSGGNNNVVPEQ